MHRTPVFSSVFFPSFIESPESSSWASPLSTLSGVPDDPCYETPSKLFKILLWLNIWQIPPLEYHRRWPLPLNINKVAVFSFFVIDIEHKLCHVKYSNFDCSAPETPAVIGTSQPSLQGFSNDTPAGRTYTSRLDGGKPASPASPSPIASLASMSNKLRSIINNIY